MTDMIQLTINTESEDIKNILETLEQIIKDIKNGIKGDFDQNASWWLENTDE